MCTVCSFDDYTICIHIVQFTVRGFAGVGQFRLHKRMGWDRNQSLASFADIKSAVGSESIALSSYRSADGSMASYNSSKRPRILMKDYLQKKEEKSKENKLKFRVLIQGNGTIKMIGNYQ